MNRHLAPVLILLATVLAATGCDSVLTAVKLPAVREDRILGEWKDMGVNGAKPETESVLIKFTDEQYWLGSADEFSKGKATPFTVVRAGGTLIAESPAKGDCVEFGVEKGQPCWTLYRLELIGDRLNWYDFDAEHMAKESVGGTLNVAHSLHRTKKKDGNADNAIFLAAEAPDLQKFLDAYVKRPGVFRLTGRLARAH